MSLIQGSATLLNLSDFDQGATITFDATPQMMDVLQRISQDSGQPLDMVFTQAIALYRAALDAASAGKHLGYAASSDVLEVEFTDLVAPRG